MEVLPVKTWGLDSFFWLHVRLFIRDVLDIKQYPGFQDVLMISNHPIVNIQVTGYAVSVERSENRTAYSVDDGTGNISCCYWSDQEDEIVISRNHELLKIGDLVTVSGRITMFRHERQLTVETIVIEEDPNMEILSWLEVIKSKKSYNKPFEMPKLEVSDKPWLTDPLNNKSDSMKQRLKEDIHELIKSKNLESLQLDMLYDVKEIKEKALLIVNEYKAGSYKDLRSDVIGTIESILEWLQKDGIIYETRYGHYEVISKEDLCQQILQIMQQIRDEEGESSSGISSRKILRCLRFQDRYKYIPKALMEQAIKSLVDDGKIDKSTRKFYYRL